MQCLVGRQVASLSVHLYVSLMSGLVMPKRCACACGFCRRCGAKECTVASRVWVWQFVGGRRFCRLRPVCRKKPRCPPGSPLPHGAWVSGERLFVGKPLFVGERACVDEARYASEGSGSCERQKCGTSPADLKQRVWSYRTPLAAEYGTPLLK